MLKAYCFLFASFFLLPVSATATVINVEYSGRITWLQGTGLGYSMGDTISGNLSVDTSKSAGDSFPDADKARYGSIGDATFVTNDSSLLIDGYPVDSLEIYDDSRIPYIGPPEDYLAIVDGAVSNDSTGASFFKSLQLYFIFQGEDWVTQDLLSGMNISTSEPVFIGPSFGLFLVSKTIQNSFGEYDTVSDIAGFDFDSIKIQSVNVNESGSLALLLLGIFGLIIKRRLH